MEITSFAYLINSSLFHYSEIRHRTGTFFFETNLSNLGISTPHLFI